MDLSRRDAFRLAFGRGDKISMEREQDSALDVMRAATPPATTPASPAVPTSAPASPPSSRFARFRARLASLFGREA
jgi:hypothetical protein